MGYYKWLATKKTFEQAFTSWVLPQNYDINTELTKKKRGGQLSSVRLQCPRSKATFGYSKLYGFLIGHLDQEKNPKYST